MSVTRRASPAASSPNPTCAVSWSSKSISSAEPSSASRETVWSIPPVGAPATSDSARMQAAASRRRPSASSGRSSSEASATATEHSRAAELESPAPTGTLVSIAMSTPGHLGPVLAERPQHPGDVRRPPGDRARPEGVDVPFPDAVLLPTGDPDPSVRARRHGGVRRVGERERQDQAAVVVGVLSDQVDPARCPADDGGVGTQRRGQLLASSSGVVGGRAGLQEGHGPHPRQNQCRAVRAEVWTGFARGSVT